RLDPALLGRAGNDLVVNIQQCGGAAFSKTMQTRKGADRQSQNQQGANQVAVTLQPVTVIIQSRLPTLIGAAEGISGQTVLKLQGVRQVMASGIVSCILQQGCLVPVVAVL